MRTRPGSKNAVHQRVKPGIGSQGVCQGFHLEVQHVLGPILAAFLKPGKGLVPVSQRHIDDRHPRGGNIPATRCWGEECQFLLCLGAPARLGV